MRQLGATGIKVSEVSLGAMMFGKIGNLDHDECIRMIHRALDAGINCVDTADVFSYGESEEIVGRALKRRRADVVLSTKVGGPMNPENLDVMRGGSRRWITRAVEDSLRRLDTDYVDVCTVNRFDERTDVDETLAALSDLVRAGKIRTIGSCTWPVERIVEAQWVSDDRRHVRMRVDQPPYSILTRGAEQALFPTCLRYGIGVMTWSPLRSGWLTGRYRRDHVDMTTVRAKFLPHTFDPARPENQRKIDAVEALVALAEEAGLSLTHLALGFTLTHPAVATVFLGPRTPEQLEDLLAGTETRLPDDVLDRIDAIVPPGENIPATYSGRANPALLDPTLRRRS
ncbi:aldo/keto reductase [Saccharopolyspora rosea]|uniref:aldo/keto reductase n=1 Tax=Saccharopolyspora rosea TaxID=524884 RepID=UPI0021D858C6|nr:aldo/keto reductase [Saccharopolyspora rosea]